MDDSESSQMEALDLSVKKRVSGPLMMFSPSSDEEINGEMANENLGAAKEDRVLMPNYKEEFSQEGMKPVDSTLHSPVPSTSRGITRTRTSHRYPQDDGREIMKLETHNMDGNEKLQKETRSFKTSYSDDASIGENVHRRKKVTGDKKCNFQCKTCRKQFTYLRGLKRHEVVHSGERRYPCDYCGKALRDSHALKVHVRRHTGEKQYSCPDCPKRFRSTSNLNQHKLVHLQERPYYPCPNCERRFTRKHYMDVHRKNLCKKSNQSK
ncbi:hypothetical protein NPIL_126901 [Nephila pilipes]|uniref:C2H2-type domain-containing protein n=1 Tax=Nephila pilipes TaxID=299642 RepID=A0A8X6MJA9_NEPPI|nr:hypothetical protein NPIL_126901 [Nephila pilipes]